MSKSKKLRKTDERKGFFWKYFSSYLAIFSIPLFLAFFTYRTAANIISRQCNDQVRKSLQQTGDIIDVRLQELESMALTLKGNDYIREFYQKWTQSDSEGDIFAAYKATRNIPNYEIINSSIDSTRLFFGKDTSCFILGAGNAVRYTQNMENLYLDGTDLDYQTFNQILRSAYFYERFLTVSTYDPFIRNVYFLSNLNAFSQTEYTSVVVIKLSNQFFTDMLHNITFDEHGTSFILTEENEIISYYQGKDSFELTESTLAEIVEMGARHENGLFQYEGNLVNLIHSDFNGWTYCSLIPQAVIIQDLTVMRQLILLVTTAVMIIGLISCYLLTKRNSKPLKNIIRTLTSVYEYGYFDSTDHFKFLENAVLALVDRNSTFQQSFDNEVLRKLFLGEYTASAEFEKELSQSSILLDENLYIIGYLHIHNLKDSKSSLSPQTIIKNLENAFYGYIHSLIIDKSNMVFLSIHQKDRAESTFPVYLKEILINLGNEILLETDCHVDFFLSEPMRHYENVCKGYEQCKRITRNVYKKSDLFVYTLEDLPPFQQIYHYTINQEIELSQLIQHGSTEKLQIFLDNLYEENFGTLILSEGMKRDLITGIQNSVRRNLSAFLEDDRINKIFSKFNSDTTIEELFSLLFNLKDAVQEHLRSCTKADTDKMQSILIEYVHKNYHNPNLTLYHMCEELEISEQTASKFFRDMGSSFPSFLEKVRIEAACVLLSEKKLTIKTISEEVGYSSDVSFRRAFKRVLGISPSEFINLRVKSSI